MDYGLLITRWFVAWFARWLVRAFFLAVGACGELHLAVLLQCLLFREDAIGDEYTRVELLRPGISHAVFIAKTAAFLCTFCKALVFACVVALLVSVGLDAVQVAAAVNVARLVREVTYDDALNEHESRDDDDVCHNM